MSLSLKATQSDNYYQPSDYDGRRHGTLNKINKTHRLGSKRKVDKDGRVDVEVRFEFPFKIWCEGCQQVIGKGSRANAIKHRIHTKKEFAKQRAKGDNDNEHHVEEHHAGEHHVEEHLAACSSKEEPSGEEAAMDLETWEFRMSCVHCKEQPLVIRTDPINHDFVCYSGCRRMNITPTAARKVGDVNQFKSVEDLIAMENNPLLKHQEKAVRSSHHDFDASKEEFDDLVALNDLRWKEDYRTNRKLNREIKKQHSKTLVPENANWHLDVYPLTPLEIENIPKLPRPRPLDPKERLRSLKTNLRRALKNS